MVTENICDECDGTGEIEKNISYDGMLEADIITVCAGCNGTGKLLSQPSILLASPQEGIVLIEGVEVEKEKS